MWFSSLNSSFPRIIPILDKVLAFASFLTVPVFIFLIGYTTSNSLNPMRWFRSDLENFRLISSKQDWGYIMINKNVLGLRMRIADRNYSNGYGTHANSEIKIKPKKEGAFFSGGCGVDSTQSGLGSILCSVEQKGKTLYRSHLLKRGSEPVRFRVPVNWADEISLIISDAGDGVDYDHANWFDLRIE